MKKVNVLVIPELASMIAAMPARRTLTSYEVVSELLPTIEAALQRGQDHEAIVELLAKQGARITRATLRTHLWRARKAARSTATTQQEQDGRGKVAAATAPQPQTAKLATAEQLPRTTTAPPAVSPPGHFTIRPDSDSI